MKKSYISLLLLMLLPMLASCSKDEIIFDHELPQFPTRDGYQLLEVIMPQGTAPTDQLYIVGDFNGGLESALADEKWQLEKAPGNDIKWGIYINPADCTEGKSLADGYYFYSKEQREERTLFNEETVHYDTPNVGERLNVTVNRWAAYFDKPVDPSEIVHDGYVIYVVDNSGYESLAMYAWGDAEAFGGWPGMTPTGGVTKDGVNYTYFDTGEANKGLNLNLIFNNNGNGSQLGDFNVTLDKDYYLELTPDGVSEYDPSGNVTHDGYAIFVLDNSGWDELCLYTWGDVNDLHGGWPGMAVTGTQTINGLLFKYFDMGEANIGKTQHVILNNNNNGKQIDDVVVYALDRDVYVELTASGAKEIDPATYTPGDTPAEPEEPVEPDTPAGPETTCHVYVQDLTGWDTLYIYAWGDKEAFGKWKGALPDSTETVDGVSYKVWTVTGNGETENLIFHNGDGTQYDAATITLDGDWWFTANADGAVKIEKAPRRHKAAGKKLNRRK